MARRTQQRASGRNAELVGCDFARVRVSPPGRQRFSGILLIGALIAGLGLAALRIDILRLKYGLEDGVEWTYPQLAKRFNTTANVAKGIVRSEVAFLRRAKKRVLQDFVGHLDDH